MGPRIAIVDDHALVRGGLAVLLRDALDAQIVFQGDSPLGVLKLDPAPEIALMDLMLGDECADPQVAGQLQESGCKVLVVSALADPDQIRGMIDAGVAGFINKSEPPEALIKAIRYVLANGTWTSPEVAALVAASVPRPALSQGQLRVLVLYASGMQLDCVARKMGISTGTAATHLRRARQKYADLGRPVGSRVELYREALADGIVAPHPLVS